MKFDALSGEEVNRATANGVFRNDHEAACRNCQTLTWYFDLDLDSPVCSQQCREMLQSIVKDGIPIEEGKE